MTVHAQGGGGSIRARLAFAAGCLAAALAPGCVDLSQPNPGQSRFAIAPATPAERGADAERVGSVRVMRARVAPPADGRMFVYRVGESEYTLDYFNVFVADPGEMITAAVVESLTRAGPFVTVVGPGGGADASLRLETSVLSMHADLRDASSPLAFVRARFTLLRDASGATTVMGQWTHEHAEPARSSLPGDLVAAWDRAWARVLAGVGQDAARALGVR